MKLKQIFQYGLYTLLCILIIYVLYSIVIGLQIRNMIVASYSKDSEKLDVYSKYTKIELLNRLDFSFDDKRDYDFPYKIKYKLSIPLVIHRFISGEGIYWYSYEVVNTDTEKIVRGWRAPVRFKFIIKDFHVQITDKSEAP